MNSSSVLIAGCGYVGTRLSELLLADGLSVAGIRRSWKSSYPPGLTPITADLTDAESLAGLSPVRQIVYAAAAGQFSEEAYRKTYVDGLANIIAYAQRCQPAVERVVFVSSTGVYGQGHGEWVDESTPTGEGGSFSAKHMLAGEKLLSASGLPTVVVRFSGIYGPGRQSLLDSVRDGSVRLTSGAPVWTNRIHREDCAQALRFLLTLPAPAPLYLATDDEPAPRDDILIWIASALGCPRPGTGSAGEASPPRGNRRCRNARLRAAGYPFVYPTYRQGFQSLIDQAAAKTP